MMNSTAKCLTWRGMGSISLCFAGDSLYDENKQPYHTETGCEIICVAPTTLAVKGQMMMVMMMMIMMTMIIMMKR